MGVQELVPPPGAELSYRAALPLAPSSRPPSENTVGVVAWLLTLRTPEWPAGRQVVAIANDITFNSGAFGPREDAIFKAATEFALAERLPVVYLAANSGARVGVANEVKQCLQVRGRWGGGQLGVWSVGWAGWLVWLFVWVAGRWGWVVEPGGGLVVWG